MAISKKPIVIIFDDFIYSTKFNNSKILNEVLFNGRFYNIFTIFIIQYPIGLCPELRTNFDNVFHFCANSISNIKRAYDHYYGFCGNFSYFEKTITSLKNYWCACTSKNQKMVLYKEQDVNNFSNQILKNNPITIPKDNKQIVHNNKKNKNKSILNIIKSNNKIINLLKQQNVNLAELLESDSDCNSDNELEV